MSRHINHEKYNQGRHKIENYHVGEDMIKITYLNVPYAEKDEAKRLGAKWDSTEKKWYCQGDINKLKRWL